MLLVTIILVLACLQQQGYSFSFNRPFSLPYGDRLACNSQYASKSFLSMEFAWKPAKKQSEDKMAKSLESIQAQFNTLRVRWPAENLMIYIIIIYYYLCRQVGRMQRSWTAFSSTTSDPWHHWPRWPGWRRRARNSWSGLPVVYVWCFSCIYVKRIVLFNFAVAIVLARWLSPSTGPCARRSRRPSPPPAWTSHRTTTAI